MSQRAQSLKKLLKDILVVSKDISVTGISCDTRTIKVGDLFIANVGLHYDARVFISDAFEKGAVAVLYENTDNYKPCCVSSFPVFPVRELSRWQGVIASRFYGSPSYKMSCIGVTGTNGKTSCVHWIADALSRSGIPCGLIGTLGYGFLNNVLKETSYTTPHSLILQAALADLYQRGANGVALEASSHALVQHRLNGMCFELGVFTQLSQDHLDYHGSIEAYIAAKRRLFEWPNLKAAVINLDDPVGFEWANFFNRRYPIISYSLSNKKASVYVVNTVAKSDGFEITVQSEWGCGSFECPVLGTFNISNVLAVLSVLGYFGVSFERILSSLSFLQKVPGRLQQLGGQNKPLVIVDYAHTADALKKVLQTLRLHCLGELWCVFGCGGDRDRSKRPQMAAIAEHYSDHVIVTHDNPRSESPNLIIDDIMKGFLNRKKIVLQTERLHAIAYAIANAKQGDLILIAGKGHEKYQCFGKEKRFFSDAEAVRWQLAQKAG